MRRPIRHSAREFSRHHYPLDPAAIDFSESATTSVTGTSEYEPLKIATQGASSALHSYSVQRRKLTHVVTPINSPNVSTWQMNDVALNFKFHQYRSDLVDVGRMVRPDFIYEHRLI